MPLPLAAVTTPGTPLTTRFSYGDRCRAPWMSWILTPGTPIAVKNDVRSAAIVSGGSLVSVSWTSAR